MILPNFVEGPRELVQVEMEKLSRDALMLLVGSLCRTLSYLGIRDVLTLEDVRAARKTGRVISSTRRCERFLADPHGAAKTFVRRQRSAKAAARRRKREMKAKKLQQQKGTL